MYIRINAVAGEQLDYKLRFKRKCKIKILGEKL